MKTWLRPKAMLGAGALAVALVLALGGTGAGGPHDGDVPPAAPVAKEIGAGGGQGDDARPDNIWGP
ncbi:hypothetical protein [Streptomyces jumonjinensis]|uniref:Uncharacterized protein n=1 Tax=Streptomyces jumonjinensis TaxID=1945 RepID=A0A646K9Z1_STRJU|nr:hypothetical protein [Streptomyces jumonjinensis]MQS98909.1 hypothetical protein [Streptomyces jumonjinensis]